MPDKTIGFFVSHSLKRTQQQQQQQHIKNASVYKTDFMK